MSKLGPQGHLAEDSHAVSRDPMDDSTVPRARKDVAHLAFSTLQSSSTSLASPAPSTPTTYSRGCLSPTSYCSSIQSPPPLDSPNFKPGQGRQASGSEPPRNDAPGHLLAPAPGPGLPFRTHRRHIESMDSAFWEQGPSGNQTLDRSVELSRSEAESAAVRPHRRKAGHAHRRETDEVHTKYLEVLHNKQPEAGRRRHEPNLSQDSGIAMCEDYDLSHIAPSLDSGIAMGHDYARSVNVPIVLSPKMAYEHHDEDDAANTADDDEASSDDDDAERVERVTRNILAQEFDACHGEVDPPPETIEIVGDCLDKLSLALSHAGKWLAPYTAAPAFTRPPSTLDATPRASLSKSSVPQRKRPHKDLRDDDDDLQGNSDEEGEGEGGSTGNQPRRQKRLKSEIYSCPFRIRNPARFNCRDWEYCAKGVFKNMSELKKHIGRLHLSARCAPGYKCVRCHAGFAKVDDLVLHMRAANICTVVPEPPPVSPPTSEDGISKEVAEALRSRSVRLDWEELWFILFPEDLELRRPAPRPGSIPIIEIYEFLRDYTVRSPELQDQLGSALSTLLAEQTAECRQVLSNSLENVFTDFNMTLFRELQASVTAKTAGSAQRPPQRPQSFSDASNFVATPATSINSPPPTVAAMARAESGHRVILPKRFSNQDMAHMSNPSSRASSAILYPAPRGRRESRRSDRTSIAESSTSRNSTNLSLPTLASAQPSVVGQAVPAVHRRHVGLGAKPPGMPENGERDSGVFVSSSRPASQVSVLQDWLDIPEDHLGNAEGFFAHGHDTVVDGEFDLELDADFLQDLGTGNHSEEEGGLFS